ncbi:hypothetical protein MAFF211471_16410 [Ralstonia solanacearum]|nr:hypothetical protein MAFF211471_16410 [Ralstonia solanacearum]BCM99107.1 hypothetical protein RPSA_16440 [Ralstonia solanacearum]
MKYIIGNWREKARYCALSSSGLSAGTPMKRATRPASAFTVIGRSCCRSGPIGPRRADSTPGWKGRPTHAATAMRYASAASGAWAATAGRICDVAMVAAGRLEPAGNGSWRASGMMSPFAVTRRRAIRVVRQQERTIGGFLNSAFG